MSGRKVVHRSTKKKHTHSSKTNKFFASPGIWNQIRFNRFFFVFNEKTFLTFIRRGVFFWVYFHANIHNVWYGFIVTFSKEMFSFIENLENLPRVFE